MKTELSKEQQRTLQNSVFVNLKIRIWGASAKLDAEEIGQDQHKEVLKIYQSLLVPEDRKLIEQMQSIRNKCRNRLMSYSVHSSVYGIETIPKTAVETINGFFLEMQAEFQNLVDRMLASETLKSVEANFKSQYPSLYHAGKYPSQIELKKKFDFYWAFRHWVVPDSEGILPDQILKQEFDKFKGEVSKIRDSALQVVQSEFVKKIETLKSQCLGSEINVNGNTLKSVMDFFDKFDQYWDGFLGYRKLSQIVNEAKDLLSDTDTAMFKADEEFKAIVGENIEEILQKVGNISQRSRRSISI